MHPLIRAYCTLKELRDLNIRPWGLYYGQWRRMIDQQLGFIAELEDV